MRPKGLESFFLAPFFGKRGNKREAGMSHPPRLITTTQPTTLISIALPNASIELPHR